MKDGWSPQLIAAVLAAEGAAKMDRVSHETIYKALYVQSRGQLRKNLYQDWRYAVSSARHAAPNARTAHTGTPSRSVTARPRSPTGPCPAIGRPT